MDLTNGRQQWIVYSIEPTDRGWHRFLTGDSHRKQAG